MVIAKGGDWIVLEFVGDMAKALGVLCFAQYSFHLLAWESDFTSSESKLEASLMDKGKVLHLCSCLGSIQLDSPEKVKSFKRRIFLSVAQFLIVLFIVCCIVVVVSTFDTGLTVDSLYPWLNLVKTLSMLIALYNFLLLARLTTGLNIEDKNLAILLCLLLLSIQASVLGPLVRLKCVADAPDSDVEQLIVNSFICFEMATLAIVQLLIFTPEDYTAIPALKEDP